ncbi:MAG TPA: GNAT family protein [Candidatus Dormibacteraeota bacterium]|jgi:RimJ/RimL family protein N-acetyltransferase|nr:GNAT family protein [Candidatus Dormibacteraeota bacterium]
MKARTAYAFAEAGLNKLTSKYLQGNEASRRAQLGAGYREVGRRREHVFCGGRWVDVILTEVLAEDWRHE